MQPNKANSQIKLETVEKFKSWIDARYSKNDWTDYIRRNALNKSEIASECGFARSAFSSNDLLSAELNLAEEKLLEAGILSEKSDKPALAGEAKSTNKTDDDKFASLQKEIKNLREKLAIKTAEIADLKAKLNNQNSILDEIIPAGKRVGF